MQSPPSLFRPLAVATGTLTVLHLPLRPPPDADERRLSAATYPVVGLLVGALPALMLVLPLPALPRAALALAVWVAVTGARHVGEWAGCCDAVLAPPGATAEETRRLRLALLRDPRTGAFGATGIALLLLGKWTALVHVPPVAPLAAAALARWTMVYTRSSFPTAHPDAAEAAPGRDAPFWAATVFAIPVLVALTWTTDGPWLVARAVLAGTLAAVMAAAWLARRFGGVTAGVCGAVGEATELVALWAFLPWGAR